MAATFLFLGLGLSGCVTPWAGDGVTVGQTPLVTAKFRGRWWSYYHRGRAAQRAGNFESAERDFKTALKLRPADQLWPRTYGMHFIPEYFPNRELAINHFLQGRLEESIAALETSLDQQYSARAAHYFREAQTAVLASTGRDTEVPTVEVEAPVTVSATEYLLRGVARDDTYVGEILVNGDPVDVRLAASEVPFEAKLAMLPGLNTVSVTVRDLAGRETVTDVRLENDVDGPSVSFDAPIAVPGPVEGVVLDPAGVAFLEIEGQRASLLDRGDGLYAFRVDVGPALGGNALNFVAEDHLGNRTAGTVPGSGPDTPPVQALRVAANLATLPGDILAQAVGEQLALAATAGPRVSFKNVEEGRRFYQDEIVLNLQVDSADAPVEQLAFNSDPEQVLGGDPIRLIPERASQFVTRRVSLEKGSNTLVAKVVDRQGGSAEDARTISRELNELEVVENLLAVTFLPRERTGEEYTAEERAIAENVIVTFQNDVSLYDRFEVVEREQLDEVLREMEISGLLAESKKALAQGQFIPFEVLFEVSVNLDQGNIEILLEGTGSETGARVVFPRIEVSGDADNYEKTIEDLIVRILQEFPRAPGEVDEWTSSTVKCIFSSDQGAQRNRKCLIFHLVGDGPPEEQYPDIIGEGLIDGVSSRYTSVKMVKSADETPIAELPIEKGHYVVLK